MATSTKISLPKPSTTTISRRGTGERSVDGRRPRYRSGAGCGKVRTLNHLTLVAPSAGTPGWEEDLGVAQGALTHLPRDATLAGELMSVGLYGDGREAV
jgi:hypothetical protein